VSECVEEWGTRREGKKAREGAGF
jgi:hypothetical protein